MATEPIRAVFGNDSGMSRPDERPAGFQEHGAAVSHQIHAAGVAIRAGDLFAPANADFIGAVRAAATQSPVHKQIIKISMPVKVSRLDGIVVGERIYRRIRRDASAGLRIKLYQFDAAPK